MWRRCFNGRCNINGSRNRLLPSQQVACLNSRSSISHAEEIHLKQQQQRQFTVIVNNRVKVKTTNAVNTRLYSSTTVLFDDEKEKDETNKDSDTSQTEQSPPKVIKNVRYQTINNTEFTDEELDALFDEVERKYNEEEQLRTGLRPNWRPGLKKKTPMITPNLDEILRDYEPEKYMNEWTHLDKRCGALAIKVGMMPVFDTWGERHPCTVLFLDNNVVLGHKTKEKHGYNAVQVAAGERKRKNVNGTLLGQYKSILSSSPDNNGTNEGNKNNNHQQYHPPYMVREFRVSSQDNLIPIKSRIHARHFVPGQNVDISGITKGKGFQGAMKRHGFGGMPASHGVSKSHRALGSTGQCQDPGKVFKGKKMAGRMGCDRVTTQNLRIVQIDCGRNLLYVKGSVPGNKGSFVEIRDAVKKPLWSTVHVPDKVDRPPLPTFAYEEDVDGSGQPGPELFMPLPEIDPLNPELNDNDAVSI